MFVSKLCWPQAQQYLVSLVFPDRREVYYRHLQTANEGDVRPFIRFIALCTEKTLDAYLWASNEYTMEVGRSQDLGI